MGVWSKAPSFTFKCTWWVSHWKLGLEFEEEREKYRHKDYICGLISGSVISELNKPGWKEKYWFRILKTQVLSLEGQRVRNKRQRQEIEGKREGRKEQERGGRDTCSRRTKDCLFIKRQTWSIGKWPFIKVRGETLLGWGVQFWLGILIRAANRTILIAG